MGEGVSEGLNRDVALTAASDARRLHWPLGSVGSQERTARRIRRKRCPDAQVRRISWVLGLGRLGNGRGLLIAIPSRPPPWMSRRRRQVGPVPLALLTFPCSA